MHLNYHSILTKIRYQYGINHLAGIGMNLWTFFNKKKGRVCQCDFFFLPVFNGLKMGQRAIFLLLFGLRIILGGPKKFIGPNTKISCKHIWNVKKKKKPVGPWPPIAISVPVVHHRCNLLFRIYHIYFALLH